MTATEGGEASDELPDYWPDARRFPRDHLPQIAEAVRNTRKALGLSNAVVGREVRQLIERHNAIPGREQVVVLAAWADRGDGERCNQELQSIGKGTRKYLVGYLAWLCLRDEATARDLYDKADIPFRPIRMEKNSPDEPDQAPEAASKDQFYVYEAAFLWYGTEPPPIRDHHDAMTPEIARMKFLLHKAIELGKLDALHFNVPPNGYARLVERNELRRFALETGMSPKFLFPEAGPSSEDPSNKLSKLETELDERLQELPIPVSNWTDEFARNEWAIYEAAFLWHSFIPPPMSVHEQVMPEPVRQTKAMLHDAVNSGALMPSIDGGIRMRNVMVHGTRYVSRPELRRFAISIEQRPRFLFPDDET